MDWQVAPALEQLRLSGRRVVLLTGRTLEQLTSVAPPLVLFDLLVLENGAVLHAPSTRQTTVLCPRPPPELVRSLSERMVGAVLVSGQAILSTSRPNEIAMLETIRVDTDLSAGRRAELAMPSHSPPVMTAPRPCSRPTATTSWWAGPRAPASPLSRSA